MEYGTVLESHTLSSTPKATKVMDEAVSLGWIKPFCEGQFIYGEKWARLVRMLQTELVKRAINLGFEEWILPRRIPRKALNSFKLTQFTPDLLIQADLDAFLDPVQCASFYHHLRGEKLASNRLPLCVVEVMGGWTWCNESLETMDGPYRAKEFLRVEHVYCGTLDQVRTLRRKVRDNITELLTQLQLGWQVVVGQGCMDIPSIIQDRLSASKPDDIPVQDIEIPIRSALNKLPNLPEPGVAKHHVYKDGKLVEVTSDAKYFDHDEICGCSVEGTHLTKDFNILDEKDQPLFSGCCGVGLNRLVLGILYHHGFVNAEEIVRKACNL